MTTLSLLNAAAGATGEQTYIEDVFSTYLYTGNGSTQTINNGIDLAGEGGMVWVKARNYDSGLSAVLDTTRGAAKRLSTNLTDAEYTNSAGVGITSFNSNGFSLGTGSAYNSAYNYASWTFRKAPKFFDVVTYTGNGTTQTINHSLGVVPGFIITKCTSFGSNWVCYHRSTGASQFLNLNETGGAGGWGYWNYTEPTASTFTVSYPAGSNAGNVNDSGKTYVAYLFAHDTDTDGLIQCGSFTANSDGSLSQVNLGWEPQYLLIKSTNTTGDWYVIDTMRGMSLTYSQWLYANTSGAEVGPGGGYWQPNATGFSSGSNAPYNPNGTYIYMAIRRGPMKTPTDGTKVFQPVIYTGNGSSSREINTTITSDTAWFFHRNQPYGEFWYDRLRGNNQYIQPSGTAAESSFNSGTAWGMDRQTSVYLSSSLDYINGSGGLNGLWCFQRAPGFFDVVCYTGTGVARTINHNLGVAPELMIVKNRSGVAYWMVYTATTGATKYLLLSTNDAAGTWTLPWNDTSPTSSVFTVGSDGNTNTNGSSFVAYLFASCPGVSKVGSYTGTGSTQTISCGFTGGARFVLIKRTDSTGDWYVWDTARGMVSGTDPSLLLNSAAAEVNANSVYTTTGGFQIVTTDASVNASGGSYIYLAVA